MALTTIEGHLASFIPSGEVDILNFLSENDLKEILAELPKINGLSITPLKQHFGERFTFGQLRMAVAFITSKK
jgi:hypothetical protein